MKAKRIMIVHMPNGDYANTLSKEILFNKIVNELVKEGREIKSATFQHVSFLDGSIVSVFKFGNGAKGMRSTHVYIDKAVLSLKYSENIINTVIKPSLIEGRNDFDLTGDRMLTYSMVDNQVITEKLS